MEDRADAGFTKGPWEAAHAGEGRHGKFMVTEYFVRRPDDDISIAADIIDPVSGAPSEANALLIAAAPDMLAEMRRFLPVLERLEDNLLWHDLTAGLGIATINGYRAAIAKAEGRI